jgi:hypothetical protein
MDPLPCRVVPDRDIPQITRKANPRRIGMAENENVVRPLQLCQSPKDGPLERLVRDPFGMQGFYINANVHF